MIVEHHVNHVMLENDVKLMTDRYLAMVYPVTQRLVDHVMWCAGAGPTAFLFSGSWRLALDAKYFELRKFRHSQLEWHANTHFVEPEETKLYHYALQKLACHALVVLHSDYWTLHRPLEDLIEHMDQLKPHTERVIVSVPVSHANFNKLSLSLEDVCARYPAVHVFDDSLVIVR